MTAIAERPCCMVCQFWPQYKLKTIICIKRWRHQKSQSSDLFTCDPNTGSLLSQTVLPKVSTLHHLRTVPSTAMATHSINLRLHVLECAFYLPKSAVM